MIDNCGFLWKWPEPRWQQKSLAGVALRRSALSCRLTLITLPALWQSKMLSLIRFLQPHSCDLRKAHEKRITMVTLLSFFENCFSCKDKRPVGEDFPRQLRHDIWCDSDWHSALPETGYTCGPGEADGLHVHGTTPLLPFFCVLFCVEGVTQQEAPLGIKLTWHLLGKERVFLRSEIKPSKDQDLIMYERSLLCPSSKA